jgi:putative flippase GtrA
MKELLEFFDFLISLGGNTGPGATRFSKYVIAAGIATIFDFSLLWLFTEIFSIHYLISGGLAFIFGSGLNYFINHSWSFIGTKTSHLRGYASFTFIGIIGLGLTIAFLFFFVEILNFNYLVARAIAIPIVLIWNFGMNSLFTFRDVSFSKQVSKSS